MRIDEKSQDLLSDLMRIILPIDEEERKAK